MIPERAREMLGESFAAALAAADPLQIVPNHLPATVDAAGA